MGEDDSGKFRLERVKARNYNISFISTLEVVSRSCTAIHNFKFVKIIEGCDFLASQSHLEAVHASMFSYFNDNIIHKK